jgi:ribosomal protein L7Ae-like RNA K-turn-binding protein
MIYIVTTSYNKINSIVNFFNTVENILKKKKYKIIIVDDASADSSKEILLKNKKKNIHLIFNKTNQGKGFSLKRAINEIKKFSLIDTILLIDIDLPYKKNIKQFLNIKKNSIKIISRRKLNSRSLVNLEKKNIYCISRFLIGYLVNFLFRSFNLIKLLDTQAGLKSFSASLLPMIKIIKTNNFLFDLELLIICEKKNILIEEVYSEHTISNNSSISFLNLKIIKNFIFDFFKICFLFHNGYYD